MELKPIEKMTKLYTYLRTLLCAATLLLGATTARAGYGDVVDFGRVALDTPYELKGDYSDYTALFIATKSGMLSVVATNGCLMAPYSDAEHTQPISYKHSSISSGTQETYDLKVEAGTAYYFLCDFCMTDGQITFSMGDKITITPTLVTPATGSTFSMSEGGNISVTFNRAVITGSAEVLAGTKTTSVSTAAWGSFLSIDVKNAVMDFMEDGTLKPGSEFTVRIHDVRAAADETVLYGTDGTLDLKYVCGSMPVKMTASSGVEGVKFLSYWMKGDPAGKLSFTFNGNLLPADAEGLQPVLSLTYGNVEGEAGSFYTEEIPYVIEGNVLTADLSGKLRRPQDMVTDGQTYEKMLVKLIGVRDAEGNYVYSPGMGTLGSFTYDMDYEEVKADVVSEFVPASGQSLEGVKEIEIWITDYEKLHYKGILFSFGSDEIDDIVVTDYKAVADTEFEGAYILTVPVPAEAAACENVTVSLHELQSADGLDHSATLTATYEQPNASGIEHIGFSSDKAKRIYTISGLKAGKGKLPSGLYIMDGKKKLVTE